MHNERNQRSTVTAIVFWASCLLPTLAWGAEPAVNTGNTSFMDGFGNPTGFGLMYLNYFSVASAKSLKDQNGNDSPVFQNPSLTALVDLNQFLYWIKMPDSAFAQPGFDLIVPLVSLSADVKGTVPTGAPPPAPAEATVQLTDNGFGLGDVTFGPFLQFRPILADHHPVFVHRVEFDFIVPTGKYDHTKQINPGSHAWALNPYWAATVIPVPRLEISTRIHYLYNFKNNNPIVEGPPPVATSTQEGQAIWDNFAVSFEILPHDEGRTAAHSLRAGLNGYYFKQITQNKSNGLSQTDTLEQTLGLGPGVMWVPTHTDAFWLNAYHEMAVQNRFASNWVQIRWAHAFGF